MNYDDETLMAYADGELDAQQRAAITAAISTDPSLARRVEQHQALRGKVAGAFSKLIEQPVPARLTDAAQAGASSAARGGNVVDFPKRGSRAPGAPWRAREWLAMAASLVLGVFISWYSFGPAGRGDLVAGNGTLLAGGQLAAALSTQLASGQNGAEPVLIGVSFKARDGAFCRSFVLRATKTAGVACRSGDEWQVPVTSTAELQPGETQQASSALTPVILKEIEARIEGDPLDAAGEAAARNTQWAASR